MIRRALQTDIATIAAINRQSFSGNKPAGVAEKWVESHFKQGDQYQYFVAEQNGQVVGYISWEIKGGFMREIPVLELEQLAVDVDSRGQGLGKALVRESIVEMKNWIKENQPKATKFRVVVWTKKDNIAAQRIYQGICNQGAKGEREIYGAEEVMLRGEHGL